MNWVTLEPQGENRTGNATSGTPDSSAAAATSGSKSPVLSEAQG